MKKTFAFDDMAEDTFCVDCKKPIKKRLSANKKFIRCFKDFVIYKSKGSDKFRRYRRKHNL